MPRANPTTNTASLDALVTQLDYSYRVIKANTDGLGHAESLVPPTPAGNCLNWVLGHLIAARCELLGFLGLEQPWDERAKEPYRRGGPPLGDPAKARPFDKLLADLDATQEPLSEALRCFPGERVTEKAPFSPTNDPEETAGSLIADFVFHEAYHAGQTGLLRRIVGRDGAIR